MLPSTKTIAERPPCPYAHVEPSPGVVAVAHTDTPAGTPASMPAAESTLLRRYGRIYAVSCAALVALSLAGIAIARYASFGAGLAVIALGSGPLAVAAFLRWQELHAHRRIPGPRPTFFLGNMKDLLAYGHGGRDRVFAELHARYGPVVRLHLCWGSRPYVSISIPSRTLYRKDMDSVRRADRTLLPVSFMGIELGAVHQRHRRDLMPFLDRRAAQARMPVVRQLSDAYVDAWRAGRHVHGDLKADLLHWSADCLGAGLFGEAWDRAADLSSYLDAIATFDEEISMRTFHPFFSHWLSRSRSTRARAAYRWLYDFLERVYERRGDSGAAEANTVHSRLVELETSGEWTRTECIEELMSLVVGGTDAMSSVLGQAMRLLADNPEVQEEVRDALDEGGVGDAHPILYAILHETMRMFPPVPFSSKFAREAVTEQGHTIPAGTSLMWMKSVIGRNPDLFNEPERFLPERFGERFGGPASQRQPASVRSPASQRQPASVRGPQSQRQPESVRSPLGQRQPEPVRNTAPFGAGPRHCIGQHVAEAQCAVLLYAVLSSLRLFPIRGVEVRLLTATSVSPSTIPVRLEPLLRAAAPS
jgi:cytochrome P450